MSPHVIGSIKFMSDKFTDICTISSSMGVAELYKLYARYSGICQEQLVVVYDGKEIPRAGNYTLSDLALVDGCEFQVSTAGSSTVVASSSMFVPLPSGEELVVPSRPAGLMNHGNTCYLNSALQSLFHTITFRNKLLSVRLNDISQLSTFISTLRYPTQIGATSDITPAQIAKSLHELQKLFRQMVEQPFSRVSVNGFIDALGLEVGPHGDPHEVIFCLFEVYLKCLQFDDYDGSYEITTREIVTDGSTRSPSESTTRERLDIQIPISTTGTT